MKEMVLSAELADLLREGLEDRRTPVPRLGVPREKWTRSERPFAEFLVERHREELGRLTYLAAKHLLVARPQRLFVHDKDPETRRGPRQSRFDALKTSTGSSEHSLLLLNAFFGQRESATPYLLARASHRLLDGPDAMVVVALALADEGRTDEACAITRSTLALRCSPETRMVALANLGAFHFSEGRLSEASYCLRDACTLRESRAFPAFNWFTTSVQLGSLDNIRKAACLLEELGPQRPSEVVECKQVLVSQIAERSWTLKDSSRRALSSWERSLPPIASEVFNVIQNTHH